VSGTALRVLFLHTDGFGGRGGIAKFNRDLLSSLSSYDEMGEIVAIPRLMDPSFCEMPPKVTYRTTGLGGRWRYIRAAAAEARAGRPFDVIACGHINLLPLAVALRVRLRLPLVLVIHGIEAWQPSGNPITGRMVRTIDRFITVSELTRQRFVAWSGVPKEKGFLLPNAIDLSKFSPGPADPELIRRLDLAGRRVVMTLGRLSAAERAKGVDEILEVLPALSAKVPEIVYMIAGEGDDVPRLTEKARSLGVADRVRFTGYIAAGEKEAHYRLADVFAMPSTGEGFGIVHLEAMACGIPVVASKLDGSREALRDGLLGRLVDPRDPGEISAAILASLDQPKGVPDGLDYYGYDRFEERVHSFVRSLGLAEASAAAARKRPLAPTGAQA
jgi:glycosyltransferase involved in cell wall biosynthesis